MRKWLALYGINIGRDLKMGRGTRGRPYDGPWVRCIWYIQDERVPYNCFSGQVDLYLISSLQYNILSNFFKILAYY